MWGSGTTVPSIPRVALVITTKADEHGDEGAHAIVKSAVPFPVRKPGTSDSPSRGRNFVDRASSSIRKEPASAVLDDPATKLSSEGLNRLVKRTGADVSPSRVREMKRVSENSAPTLKKTPSSTGLVLSSTGPTKLGSSIVTRVADAAPGMMITRIGNAKAIRLARVGTSTLFSCEGNSPRCSEGETAASRENALVA